MSKGLRAMRRLSTELVRNLPSRIDDEEIIPAVGNALSRVRGRPVRVRRAAFPPATASGVWIDRSSHDLIVYEENTDPEHQLVIIGHEAWHMFQGHGRDSRAPNGAASRAADPEAARALEAFITALSEATDTDLTPLQNMDIGLHFAARTDECDVHEELEAERFGFRFATDVRLALDEARAAGDPRHLTGRIEATMAHRFRRT
ncbi:toxin-antitoxin system, toxin component [Streptomyces sp. NPDC094149]|uniref:toxin-antitoxin system, toxin component n=1 Tax=Streptomyces sp. NPDC094149 TaxID=3155079 RepID=UPI00332B5488